MFLARKLLPLRSHLIFCALSLTLYCAFILPAQAQVVFPQPGAMQLTGLPSQLRAGATLTVHEELPLAVQPGTMLLQKQLDDGSWQTLAHAAVRPRLFFLRWKVPAGTPSSQITVRFVLKSGPQTLALSALYHFDIKGASAHSKKHHKKHHKGHQ